MAQGINISNILSLLNGFASDEDRDAVMSLNGAILRLGQTLGPVLMSLAAASSIGGAYFAAAMFLVALALLC